MIWPVLDRSLQTQLSLTSLSQPKDKSVLWTSLYRLTLAKIQGLAELGNWGSVDTPTFLWQESRFHITTEDVSFANGGHIQ